VIGGALRAPLGQNASGYLVYRGANGRRQMAGYSRLGAHGANQAGNWRLVTLASYDAILAPVTQSFNPTLGILVATLVGAVGLGLWMARRLAHPILKLTEGAKTIAAGRFDARVGSPHAMKSAHWPRPSTSWPVRCKRRSPNAPKLRRPSPSPTTSWSGA
jgi:HAMP domain-containing protein